MKSLICSDIHDHLDNLRKALVAGTSMGISSVICCGDLCSPFVLDEFYALSKVPVHIVFGNNDGDRFTMSQKINLLNRENSSETIIFIHGEYLLKKRNKPLPGVPDDKGLFVTHYPEIAYQAVYAPDLDVVLYGHNHQPHSEIITSTLIANPGSLMGYLPSRKEFTNPSFMILDWDNTDVQLMPVK